MVPGRRGDDPGLGLGFGEVRDPVRRAAQLERAGPLETFELEVQPGLGQTREVGSCNQRGPESDPSEPFGGLLHVGELHRNAESSIGIPTSRTRGVVRINRSARGQLSPLRARSGMGSKPSRAVVSLAEDTASEAARPSLK